MSDAGTVEEEGLSTPSEVLEEEQEEAPGDGQRESEGEPTKLPVNPSLKQNKSKTVMTLSNNNPERDMNPTQDPKMPRRFAQISEENALLKRQLRKQEDRIKVLATKLIRLISERSSKTKREEILLEEQKARIHDLEHEVSNLREKLHVTKQQLSSYTRLIPHHHHPPPSRQTSVLSSSTATTHSKFNKKSRSTSAAGSQPPRPATATSASRGNLLNDKQFAERVEELLLEAKAENQALEDQLKHCRQRLAATEEELEKVKTSMQGKEAEHKEEILSIKAQLGKEQDIAKKKKQLSDNIQLIRIQRDSRRTASWLSTLEAQCRALEISYATATENVQQLEVQLSEVQEELGQEQQKNITLQKQMEDATNSLSRLKELEAQIIALQEENKILTEANDSLLKKAFSVTEKAEKAESVEMTMRVQMTHLESCLKTELTAKTELQQSLRIEKEKCVRLEFTNEKLQETIDKLNDEMKKFKLPESSHRNRVIHDADENCDNSDTTVRDSTVCTNSTSGVVSREDKTDKYCEHQARIYQLEKELSAQKLELSSLSGEHSKTKAFLKAQVASNKEYQLEVEKLTRQLDEADEFHHKKLQDFVTLLEERTRQIAQLEIWVDEWKDNKNSELKAACSLCPPCQHNIPETENDTTNTNLEREMHASDTENSNRPNSESEEAKVTENLEDENTHEDNSLIQL